MKNLIIACLISVGFFVTVYGQYGSEGNEDARRMGLGNTSNAISQGVYSIGINPANLLNSYSTVDLSTILPLPHISASAGTNFITINNINYYSGRFLNDNDKQNLNTIFQNGGIVQGNASVTLLSFGLRFGPSIGAIGFSINDFVESDFTVPHSLSNLLLNGNPQNSIYTFDDTKFNAWYVRSYSLSYARDFTGVMPDYIKSLTAGLSIKYYQGFAYAQSMQVNNNSLQTGSNNQIILNSNYVIHSAFSNEFNIKYSFDSTTTNADPKASPFPSPVGTGLGFDIGFNADIYNNWNVSLAITDIGSILWNKSTAITTSNGQYTLTDLFNSTQGDSIKNKFKGISVPGGSFTTQLPTTLRIGAAHKFYSFGGSFPGTLLLAVDINHGFNNEPGNSTDTRYSFGGEWQMAHGVPFIRTGISFGGLLGFHWGLGLGIDTGLLEFNFATLDLQSLVKPNSAKYLSVALDSRWKF